MLAFAKQVAKEYGHDKVSQLSAAFSYFTLFSIGPLLLVLVSIAGFVFGEKAANGQLAAQLSGTFDTNTADALQNVVVKSSHTSSGVIGLVIGAVTLVLGASGLFGQLHGSLNQIFKVKADPKAGWINFVWPRLKGIVLLVIISILVIASIIASTLLAALGKQASDSLGLPSFSLKIMSFLFSTIIIGLLLSLLYRVLPDIRLPNRIVLVTGLSIGLLFSLGKEVLAFVIGHNGTASTYGAAAALITLLLWVFYFGQIIFLGAEIIKVYGDREGLSYVPKKLAVKQKFTELDLTAEATKMFEAFGRGLKKSMTKK